VSRLPADCIADGMRNGNRGEQQCGEGINIAKHAHILLSSYVHMCVELSDELWRYPANVCVYSSLHNLNEAKKARKWPLEAIDRLLWRHM
jgi:hypothetical protein